MRWMREKGGRDWFWGLKREMIVLGERLSVLFMKWEWTHGWLLLRRWIDDDLYDRYEWFEPVCVFVFSSTMREREREREIYIQIDWRVIEKINNWNWEMSEWFQIVFKTTNSLFPSFSFFFLCSSPPHPSIHLHPSTTQNLLSLSCCPS